MKHASRESLSALLSQIGAELDAPRVELLWRHLEWLLETNERLNLTSVTDRGEAMRLHVVDSLLALPEIVAAPEGEGLDLGTGGGFPGLPLAIASSRAFVLLDSVQKKAAVLEEFVRETGVPVRVFAGRSEELARRRPRSFSLVVARAVSSLPSLVELASPLLCEGGHLVALKGRPTEDEVVAGREAGALVGMELATAREAPLPAGEEVRVIFVFEKRGEPSIPLPRREGLAQRKPLA